MQLRTQPTEFHAATPKSAPHVVVAHAVIDSSQAHAFVANLPSVRKATERFGHTLTPHSPNALSAVHELAWGRALGLAAADLTDGCVPMAALMSANPTQPQAWVSLCHWDVAVDTARLISADLLQISEQEIEQTLRPLADLAADDGWDVLGRHPSQAATFAVRSAGFKGLAVASWSRVADARFQGGVDAWLGAMVGQNLRQLRRLQNEFQMLMYTHRLSDARSQAGLLPINSFWLHGAGAVSELPAGFEAKRANTALHMGLADSALRGDLAAWQASWRELDAVLGAALQRGELKSLTLCGPKAYASLGEGKRGFLSRIYGVFSPWSPDSLIAML